MCVGLCVGCGGWLVREGSSQMVRAGYEVDDVIPPDMVSSWFQEKVFFVFCFEKRRRRRGAGAIELLASQDPQ